MGFGGGTIYLGINMTEDRGQKTEGRGQKTEGRGRRAEDRDYKLRQSVWARDFRFGIAEWISKGLSA